jgi:hypothetical protein
MLFILAYKCPWKDEKIVWRSMGMSPWGDVDATYCVEGDAFMQGHVSLQVAHRLIAWLGPPGDTRQSARRQSSRTHMQVTHLEQVSTIPNTTTERS